MLNSCFDKFYRILGLRGGGLYPYFVAIVLVSMNFYHQIRPGKMGFPNALEVVTRIERVLLLVLPVTCVLESRIRWGRIKMHQDVLARIKEVVGSRTKYKTSTLIQQVFLLIYTTTVFLLEDSTLHSIALAPQYFVYFINYAAMMRYSDTIWTIEDVFKHLNYKLEATLAFHRPRLEHAISRICVIHRLLVDQSMELNENFQVQMLVSLTLIFVRCLTYPSIVVFLWGGPISYRLKCYFIVTMILVDLVHVTNIFHPPSMAVLQAANTYKVLRRVANKHLLDTDVVRFFMKKLMLQELRFSLCDLVEQNDQNIILVMESITTRLFIMMTF